MIATGREETCVASASSTEELWLRQLWMCVGGRRPVRMQGSVGFRTWSYKVIHFYYTAAMFVNTTNFMVLTVYLIVYSFANAAFVSCDLKGKYCIPSQSPPSIATADHFGLGRLGGL